MTPERIERCVTSVTWIPSEAIEGLPKAPFSLGATHYDDPPPDTIDDVASLAATDRCRFANELRAWIDVDDGRIIGAGHTGRGHLGSTTVAFLGMEAEFEAVALPDLRNEPVGMVGSSGAVRFQQTAGGKTGIPSPRFVRRAPFVQLRAPTAWTTLSLTIHADGSSKFEVAGASPFPRHWIYDHDGRLAAKTGVIDFTTWYRESHGTATPWGDEDSPALVAEVVTALERELSRTIMRDGARPTIDELDVGGLLTVQGEPGREMFVLLDGLCDVEVDGEVVADVGPGAVLGERALLEGGVRTSTLRATTPVKVARVSEVDIDPDRLTELREHHRREDAPRG